MAQPEVCGVHYIIIFVIAYLHLRSLHMFYVNCVVGLFTNFVFVSLGNLPHLTETVSRCCRMLLSNELKQKKTCFYKDYLSFFNSYLLLFSFCMSSQ